MTFVSEPATPPPADLVIPPPPPSPEAVDLVSEVAEEAMGEGASDTASDAAVLDSSGPTK